MRLEIKIVYIDDNIDEILSRYISQVYCATQYIDINNNCRISKTFEEVEFNGEQGYEGLLNNPQILSANVILVDNHLFEERLQGQSRFSGKQFKIMLRKLLPFVEVLIITQDEQLESDTIILKYSNRHSDDSDMYYQNKLGKALDTAIREVLIYELLANDLRKSPDVEKALIDKILQSLQGNGAYNELTKADVDELITSFKELKEKYEHQ